MAIEIGMLLFPGLTQLDLTGPHEVLARVPDARLRLVARTLDPVRAETGITILPDATFEDVTQLDVLFVPGGAGQIAAAEDGDTLAFLRRVGATATWVTSACTGSLLLGAAGLLRGDRAATHWAFMDLLPLAPRDPPRAARAPGPRLAQRIGLMILTSLPPTNAYDPTL